MSKDIRYLLIMNECRAYETLSDDRKKQIYDSTGMDSNEQQQAEAGGGNPFGTGFGFNPFGEAFWSKFTGGSSNEGR
jgi:DnaJ-class molecular chaperone